MEAISNSNTPSASTRWESQIAIKSVHRRNDKGDSIIINLEGNSYDRPFSDDDIVKIAPYLKQVCPFATHEHAPL
jgi:hypothetical protein